MDNEVFVHELSFLTLLSALDNLCDTVLLNSKISALLCCDPNKKDQRQKVLIATYCAVIAKPFLGELSHPHAIQTITNHQRQLEPMTMKK